MQNEFQPNIDELVKNQKAPVIVIPVKTGIQESQSRRGRLPLPDQVEDKLGGSDCLGDSLRDHHFYFLWILRLFAAIFIVPLFHELVTVKMMLW